jgi:hypothetical protein
MGILVLLFGLAAAGVLADVAVENHSGSAPTEAVDVFGQTVHLSTPELAVAGAVLGAAAVVLIGLGLALLGLRLGRRRGQQAERRELDQRLEHLSARSSLLESQNASLMLENEELRRRAEELERTDAGREAQPEGFGPPSRQVSGTALISPPPAPESPVHEANTPRDEVGDSWTWASRG